MTTNQVAASFIAGPNPEVLSASTDGAGNVTLIWPGTPLMGLYSLQSSSGITPATWVNVGIAPTLVNGTTAQATYQVTVPASGVAKFYRLIK